MEIGCWLRALSLFGRGGLWLYYLGGIERGVRYSFSGLEILLGEGSLGGSPRWTDSGLKILHGGVGGDVELGARTSKHILS